MPAEPAAVNGTLVPAAPAPAAVAVAAPGRIGVDEMRDLFQLARALSDSGFFRDVRDANQAFAKLVFGRDLGVGISQAMTDIHIVEGKPEASANLQAAKVLSSGRYDYTVLAHDEHECSIEFTRIADGKVLGVSTFTMDDARRAGLDGRTSTGKPGMYEKYARNMLFARAISNGVAWFCPDIFSGIRVYSEGEIPRSSAPRPADGPAAPSAPEQEPVEPAAQLDDVIVDTLRRGVEAAGWEPARLANELTRIGVVDTSDPVAALSSLDPDQATALSDRLNAAADTEGVAHAA